jgi:uncharacterized protein YcsI (UPF0317 family)
MNSPFATGQEARQAIRQGEWNAITGGLAPGHVQANLVILPQAYAFDFLRFCMRNPKPCPVLDVTDPGSPHPSAEWAEGADLRTDIPRYRVYEKGELAEELTDIRHLWRADLVAFLLGCSFTFENALVVAGLPMRYRECGCNVSVYTTNWLCQPAGVFEGPLVVSMRPIPGPMVTKAVQITSRYPAVHGAPVHIGDPAGLGITDLNQPNYGDPVPIYSGEVPVFWACGVTPQAVALAARFPWMITHAPGHMFITDRLDSELAVF